MHPRPSLRIQYRAKGLFCVRFQWTDLLPHDNARRRSFGVCRSLDRASFLRLVYLLLSQRSSLQPLSCVITVSMPGHAQFYLKPSVICLMGGLLPFGSIFIEMYFIFTSFWNYKVRSCAWQAGLNGPGSDGKSERRRP